MKSIDGINLSDLIKKEQDEYLAKKTEEVLAAVRGIQANRRSWAYMIEQKAKEIEKLQEKLQKADAQMARLSSGDWSVLPES